MVATAKEVDEATEEMKWRQVHRRWRNRADPQQRWCSVTAAVEEEFLEVDTDAPRSMSATAADMAQYLEVDCSEEEVMAAAEVLHTGFEAWDREQRAERFRQFAETVGVHWEEVADEEVADEESYSVPVKNLSDDATTWILMEMFSQVGEVRGSFVLSADCGTVVVFGNPEDAFEAARGFDGVELCGGDGSHS